jgi:hypothetical protein
VSGHDHTARRLVIDLTWRMSYANVDGGTGGNGSMIVLTWIGYILLAGALGLVGVATGVWLLGKGITGAFEHNQRTCDCRDCVRRRGDAIDRLYKERPEYNPLSPESKELWRRTHSNDTPMVPPMRSLRDQQRAYPKGNLKKDISSWDSLEHPGFKATTELNVGDGVSLGGSTYRVISIGRLTSLYVIELRNLQTKKIALVKIAVINAERKIWNPLRSWGK